MPTDARTTKEPKMSECEECGGSGEVECPEMCSGDIDCEVCGGEGVTDCLECS
jgi:hypothetical protein